MPTRRPHLPADERRAITVQAVVELAATRNPGDITTAAIAEHMKLTQGALFRHFPTKDALWKAVMQWMTDQSDGTRRPGSARRCLTTGRIAGDVHESCGLHC